MSDALIEAARILGAAAAIVAACALIGRVILGMHRTASRIEKTFELVHHELNPNNGGSVRDAIDRIETKSDDAATLASEAVRQASYAAKHSAEALARIERIEQGPRAVAISVAPQLPIAPDDAG